MQHRKPIEPVVVSSIAHLKFGGSGAEQRALEPGRQFAGHGERHGLGDLGLE
jgi:hypothetical protein